MILHAGVQMAFRWRSGYCKYPKCFEHGIRSSTLHAPEVLRRLSGGLARAEVDLRTLPFEAEARSPRAPETAQGVVSSVLGQSGRVCDALERFSYSLLAV